MQKISIITVVRNAAAELDATLRNLESLDYPEIEIIVIDGASTDSTADIMAKHSDKIAYSVSEPDNGLYDAMNKGIAAATGDYIWFINAGDKVFASDILAKIFHATDNDTPERADKYADIYYGETMVCSAEGERLGLRRKKLPAKLTWKSLRKGMVVCHQSFIVKRIIAPMYDLRYKYVADIDWVIKCLRAAEKIENTGLILSEFAEGGISSRHRKASLRERWKVMVKHYGFLRTFIAHIVFAIELPLKKKHRDITI